MSKEVKDRFTFLLERPFDEILGELRPMAPFLSNSDSVPRGSLLYFMMGCLHCAPSTTATSVCPSGLAKVPFILFDH